MRPHSPAHGRERPISPFSSVSSTLRDARAEAIAAAAIVCLLLALGVAAGASTAPREALGERIAASSVDAVAPALPPLPAGARPFLVAGEPLSDGRLPSWPTPAPSQATDAGADAPAVDDRRAIWNRLADCESGEWDRNAVPAPGSARWDYGTRPGENGMYEGGLQFLPATWDGFRDPGMPDHAGNASPEQQIAVAERVLAAQGWGAWPVCSRKIGVRS